MSAASHSLPSVHIQLKEKLRWFHLPSVQRPPRAIAFICQPKVVRYSVRPRPRRVAVSCAALQGA
ncbi:telomere repeat-binding protein 2 [Sesbania bispinosa]|nr:telomere repeat-binding protein 2 [Sesbania bispinosa]